MRQAPYCLHITYLAALFVLNALAQSDTEESALLDFAYQLDNFQDLVSSPHWHGWGKDTNVLCPSRQITTYREQLCEPSYPGSIDPNGQSWTGITCTPDGKVLCLSLPGWGLQGNTSALEQLQSLSSLQHVNLANNSLTGTLPASLSAIFRTHNHGAFPTISVVHLSNNSITGTLPSQWGEPRSGWGITLERMYLDNNQLTGNLPQLWSDSNSLSSLERLDLFNNQLTGPVEWDARHLPKLGTLVLSPGNAFCGNVPRTLEGVVRSVVGVQDGQEPQLKVTHFLKPCPNHMMGSTGVSEYAFVTGLVPAVVVIFVAAALLVLRLSTCRRNQKAQFITNGWSSNTIISASHVHRGTTDDLSGISAKPQNSLSASNILDSCTTCQLTSTSAPPTTGHTTHTEFCTALGTFGTEHCRCLLSLSQLQAEGTFRLIPAPLWQEVAIPADRVCIAQTSAGQDWMLGQGSYSKVFKGAMDGVHDVAVKVFSAPSSAHDMEVLHTEIAVLRSCNSSNIVQFHGVCSKQDNVWVVMELLEQGSLYNSLERSKRRCMWYHRGASIALDIAKGVYYLHSHNIMHLDLKSPNILLAADYSAKIADVGLSRIFTTQSMPVAMEVGTFHWMAPELLSVGKCTEKADIFSFGVVLYEILTGARPIRGRMKSVKVPRHCPLPIFHLMNRCLSEQPEERPSAADLVQIIAANLPQKSELARRQ